MDKKEILQIEGMSCAACALRIEKNLSKIPGVKQATVNFATEKAAVEYDPAVATTGQFEETVKNWVMGLFRPLSRKKR